MYICVCYYCEKNIYILFYSSRFCWVSWLPHPLASLLVACLFWTNPQLLRYTFLLNNELDEGHIFTDTLFRVQLYQHITLPPIIRCGFIYINMYGTHFTSHLLWHNAYHIPSHLAYHTCNLQKHIPTKLSARYIGAVLHLAGLSIWRACYVRLHWRSVRSVSVMLKWRGFPESPNTRL